MVENPAGKTARCLTGAVCVVDGDHGIRNSLRVLLKTLDITVFTFTTAEEFLVGLEGGEPSFLITELNLPGITGFQLKEVLDYRNIPVPVLGLTDRIVPEDRKRALRLGFLDLVEKPFVYRPVLERVQEALKRPSVDGPLAQ